MYYYINFRLAFLSLIPGAIRAQRLNDWVGTLLTGLQPVNDLFVNLTDLIRYKLEFNGQVAYLETYLNNAYDPTLKRIYIDDPLTTTVQPPYIFNVVEGQNTATVYNVAETPDTIYIWNSSELVGSDDFVVNVPTSVWSAPDEPQWRQYIDTYKPAGRRYSFDTF